MKMTSREKVKLVEWWLKSRFNVNGSIELTYSGGAVRIRNLSSQTAPVFEIAMDKFIDNVKSYISDSKTMNNNHMTASYVDLPESFSELKLKFMVETGKRSAEKYE